MAAVDVLSDADLNRHSSVNSAGSQLRRRSLRNVRDSSEDLRRKAARPGDGLLDLAAGRGNQFRVGTVRGDGLIFLRPVKRPQTSNIASLRGPLTPPETPHATQTFLVPEPDRTWRGSVFSGTGTLRSSYDPRQESDDRDPPRTPPESTNLRKRTRSHSFSTSDELVSARRGHTVRIIVNQASPKDLVDASDTSSSPEARRVSSIARHDFSTGSARPAPPSSYRSVSHDGSSVQRYLAQSVKQRRTLSSGLLPSPMVQQAAAVVVEAPTVESVNDTSVVRRSAATGRLVGATADQLIAQVTSPNTLDYDLLSDFFLTYRFFLPPDGLLIRLLNRLRWAIDLGDDYGRVVRVRTFVALRHWILNYFVADFVMNYELRLIFCNLINQLCQDLMGREQQGRGDLNILNQLKKCWRRTVALYWDTEDLMKEDSAAVDVTPGGYVGSREPVPYSRPSNDEGVIPEPPSSQQRPSLSITTSERPISFVNMEAHQAAVGKALVPAVRSDGHRPRHSESSVHVVSCSVPKPSLQKTKKYLSGSLAPRPAPTDAAASKARGRSPVSAAVRRSRASDNLEDIAPPHVEPGVEQAYDSQAVAAILPGSLIRGLILTPESPLIEQIPPSTPAGEVPDPNRDVQQRRDRFSQHFEAVTASQQPGVKGILKTMRRALSNKRHRSPHGATEVSNAEKPPRVPSRIANGRISRSASRNGLGISWKPATASGRTRLRIDLLAAGIAEAFKEAVREEQEAQRQRLGQQAQQSRGHERGMSSAAEPTLDPSMLDSPKPKSKSNTLASRAMRLMDDKERIMSGLPNIARPLTQPDEHNEQLDHDEGDSLSKTPSNIDPLHELFATLRVDQRPQSQTSSMPSANVPQHRKDRSREEALKRLESSDRFNPLKANPTAPTTPAATDNDESRQLGFDQALESAKDEMPTGPRSSTSADKHTSTPSRTETTSAAASRGLRRRPGGDLRAADNVDELKDNNTVSTGSLMASPPQHISVPARKTSARVMQQHAAAATARGNTVGNGGKSNAKLSPSFEAQVRRLAQLPDEDDDGGRESTLLKLEGRYERSSGVPSPSSPSYEVFQRESMSNLQVPEASHPVGQSSVDDGPFEQSTRASSQRLMQPTSSAMTSRDRLTSFATSDDSRSSIPLLQRGVSQQASIDRSSMTTRTPATQAPSESASDATQRGKAKLRSQQFAALKQVAATRNDSPRDAETNTLLPTGSKVENGDPPLSRSENRSFYNSDSDSRFELDDSTTSDTEEDEDEDDDDDGPLTPLETATLDHIGPHSTIGSPHTLHRGLHAHNPSISHPKPQPMTSPPPAPTTTHQPALATHQPSPETAHLPFILAYPSKLLAEQFTLIEKDALGEIDWRELIECRWNHAPRPVHSWVDFLRQHAAAQHDPHATPISGVDICIARNNVMVQWASSEIVLTADPHERAAAVTKYIHIAAHARALRNWATAFQLTLALVSADIARLRTTWSLVAPADLATLAALEALISPTRNFARLRAEIEAGLASDPSAGCIPWLGIYTHDLAFNAQKPLYLQRTAGEQRGPGQDAVVNFERMGSAAGIVKDLLRVFEAAGRYCIPLEREVAGKCLWMGALGEGGVGERSRLIEP